MSDLYIRKFRPNAKHIIAYVLILLSAVLFINGFHRACRISGRHTMIEFTFDYEIHKNDSILFSPSLFKATLKESENKNVVCFHTLLKGIITEYECFIVQFAGKYRPVMVKKDTAEYDKVLKGEEVSGYFTEKDFDYFPEFVLNMHNYYELENKITDKDYSKLGIVIVDRKKELLSFMWGIPFLVIGLILFKIAGSVFFYLPECIAENESENQEEKDDEKI